MIPQSLRYTLRFLGRNRGFACVAVVSLALGIGANTAIFTLLNALVLRELPVQHPERLVTLSAVRPDGSVPFSYPMFREVERGQQVFSEFFAWSGNTEFSVEVNGSLSQEPVRGVTGRYYAALGTRPLLGRLISQDDVEAHGGSSVLVAVLGYEYWHRRFGGAADVVGKQLHIEGQPLTVIGVTPRWFQGMTPGEPADITVPVSAFPVLHGSIYQLESRAIIWLSPCGRLKPGITLPQARTQLESFWPDVLLAAASTDVPGPRRQRFLSMGLGVASAATGVAKSLRQQYSRPLYVLLGVVGLILLLACLNLANLLLARAASRSQEMGVRVALGASRGRLVRLMLTESLALSFAGAAAGLAFAYWGSGFLLALLAPYSETPMLLDVRPEWRVLFATMAAALFTGILSGLAPAWRASRERPGAILQQATRSVSGGTGNLGRALIIGQVSLSLVLLLGAGLLVQSFLNLSTQRLGFEQQSLLEVELNPRPGVHQDSNPLSYHAQLLEHVAALPGVRSVALSNMILPSPHGSRDAVARSSADPVMGPSVMTDSIMVSPRFLETLGVSVVSGRDFDWSDDEQHPAVAILSRRLAGQLFPAGRALGQHIRFGVMPDLQSLEVVGIAEDARIFDLRSPAPSALYFPGLQHPTWMWWGGLYIRAQGDPLLLAQSASREVESLGREYALHTRTVAQVTGQLLVPERLLAILSGFFAVLALLLASVGLFGLMSYTVTRRTREIGIRAALGAQRASILWGVLQETLLLAFVGLLIGIPCALGAGRLVSGMLFGVSSSDPTTLAAVTLVLLAAALLAGFLPARRAARVDPIVALRAE